MKFNWKDALVTIGLAVGAIALVFRIATIRKAVVGS
jgi:hypothetical protein